MIIESSKYRRDKIIRVSIKCDECGSVKEQTLQSAKRGRKIRGREIDLCGSCAYLNKYKRNKTKRGKGHHSLQKCTANLLKIGLVGFNREKKEYFVV